MLFVRPVYRALLPLLPGAVYFGRLGICARVDAPVRRILASVASASGLSGAQLGLGWGLPDEAVRASVRTDPGGGQAELMLGKVQSLPGTSQRWEAVLSEPALLHSVAVTSEPGSARRALCDLTIELETSEGEIWRFANGETPYLSSRLDSFVRDMQRVTAAVAGWKARRTPQLAGPLERLLQAVQAFEAQGRAILLGETVADDRSKALRRDLLRSILAVADELGPRRLGKFMDRVHYPVSWLLDRTRRPGACGDVELDIRAAAFFLTARVLRKGGVPRRDLREWGAFLSDAGEIGEIERLLNEWAKRGEYPEELQPLLFRKHGISGSILRRDAEDYVAGLRELAEHFAAIGYALAICYGTLLGAVRERSFIAHDDDVDTVFPLKGGEAGDFTAEMAAVRAALAARGVVTYSRVGGRIFLARPPGRRFRIDVFPIESVGPDQIRMLMQRMRPQLLARDTVLPFGEIEFLGQTLLAPAQPEAFLEARYGETWRQPIRWISRSRVLDLASPVTSASDSEAEGDGDGDSDSENDDGGQCEGEAEPA